MSLNENCLEMSEKELKETVNMRRRSCHCAKCGVQSSKMKKFENFLFKFYCFLFTKFTLEKLKLKKIYG